VSSCWVVAQSFFGHPLSPTSSLLTGHRLDFHQLADYHANRTASLSLVRSDGMRMGGAQLIYDATPGAISLSTKNITGNGIATSAGLCGILEMETKSGLILSAGTLIPFWALD